MGVYCLLVEGLTEEIYFEKLLYWIRLRDNLKVSKKLSEVLDDSIHPNKVWIKSVIGDGSFGSYIKKNKKAFVQTEFEKIILVRDLYSGIRKFAAMCKGNLIQYIMAGIPDDIKAQYAGRIHINFSVQEIEAWFFADMKMLSSFDPRLTEEYINTNYRNGLSLNPEDIARPSSLLKKILLTECRFNYMKHEKEIYRIVSKINMNNYIGLVGNSYAQSLSRIIQFFRSELSNAS